MEYVSGQIDLWPQPQMDWLTRVHMYRLSMKTCLAGFVQRMKMVKSKEIMSDQKSLTFEYLSLYTGLFSPSVISVVLHLQTMSTNLEFAQNGCVSVKIQ